MWAALMDLGLVQLQEDDAGSDVRASLNRPAPHHLAGEFYVRHVLALAAQLKYVRPWQERHFLETTLYLVTRTNDLTSETDTICY